MRKILSYLFYLPAVALLLTFAACGDDDDDPVPADPTISLNSTSANVVRGGTVEISGSVTSPGGFASLTASGNTVTGLTAGGTETQNFSFTATVDASSSVGSTITIDLVVTDALDQEGTATFTITVLAQDAPTINISGDTSAELKRREVATINLNITAAEGIDELVVTNAADEVIATVEGSMITDPANFSWEYTIPDEATPGSDIVLTHSVTDNAGQMTSMDAVFTISVQEFDVPTVAFADFPEGETQFNEGSTNDVILTVTKDDLVAWNELTSVKTVNGDAQTPEALDISSETGSTITFSLSVAEVFLDEVELLLILSDEFESETETIDLQYDVWTTDGNAFRISDVTVGSTAVKKVEGNINEDVTFMAANDYWLTGGVEVSDDATLTIQASTTIYAEPGGETQLEIDDSGVLMAEGTASDPIVFTSGAILDGGMPEAGDWSGVRIEGDAEVNSGILRYARIEYGGNGDAALRLNNLDESTTIEFVQIYRGSADQPGVELRGGNVHISNLVITECAAISLDLDDDDDGFIGSLQFVIISSSEFLVKQSTAGDDVRDFEVRDDSNPTMSNVTILGSGNGTPEGDSNGVRIRDDAAGMKLYNFLVAEYNNDGIRQDDVDNITDLDGDFVFAHSMIFQIGDQPTRDDFDDPDTGKPRPLAYETDAAFLNTIDAGNTPAEATGIGVDDFVPNAPITLNAFDPTTLGGSFQAGTYIGAIGSTDWTLGWTLEADGSVRE